VFLDWRLYFLMTRNLYILKFYDASNKSCELMVTNTNTYPEGCLFMELRSRLESCNTSEMEVLLSFVLNEYNQST
jgi:hypothetical protein